MQPNPITWLFESSQLRNPDEWGKRPVEPPGSPSDPAAADPKIFTAGEHPPTLEEDDTQTMTREECGIMQNQGAVSAHSTRTERAETRTAQAETRTDEANVRTEQAETRTKQANARTDEANARTEQAETRTRQANARTDEANTRTEQAEMRTEQAEIRTEQAEARSETAARHSKLG
jgi:hypothetical protein